MLTSRVSRRTILKAGALGSATLAVPLAMARRCADRRGVLPERQAPQVHPAASESRPRRHPAGRGGHDPAALVAARSHPLHDRHRAVHRPAAPGPPESDSPVGFRSERELPAPRRHHRGQARHARPDHVPQQPAARRTSCRSIARSWAPRTRTTGQPCTCTAASFRGRATAGRSLGGTRTTTRVRASSTTRRSGCRTPLRTRPSTTTRTTRAPDSSGTTTTRWARPG